MLTLMSTPLPFISCSLSRPHISTSHFVLCLSGPVDLNLMSKCAPCLTSPCQNNGTCVSDITGSYHCTCPFGYKVSERPPPHIHPHASFLSSCTRVQNTPMSYVHHFMHENLIIHLPELNPLDLKFLDYFLLYSGRRCLCSGYILSGATLVVRSWADGKCIARDVKNVSCSSEAIYSKTSSYEK